MIEFISSVTWLGWAWAALLILSFVAIYYFFEKQQNYNIAGIFCLLALLLALTPIWSNDLLDDRTKKSVKQNVETKITSQKGVHTQTTTTDGMTIQKNVIIITNAPSSNTAEQVALAEPQESKTVVVSNPHKPTQETRVERVTHVIPTTHITTHGAPLVSQIFDLRSFYNTAVVSNHNTQVVAPQMPQQRERVVISNPHPPEQRMHVEEPGIGTITAIYCPAPFDVEDWFGSHLFSNTERSICLRLETNPVHMKSADREVLRGKLEVLLKDFFGDKQHVLDDNHDYDDPSQSSDQAKLQRVFKKYLNSKKGSEWNSWLKSCNLSVAISFYHPNK